MKKLDNNPFLELEFEELFNIPLVSTQDAKENNKTTVTEPEPAKIPVFDSSSGDIQSQSIANMNVLLSSAADSAENMSSQLLSDFIQSIVKSQAAKYGVIESVVSNVTDFQLNEILSDFGHSDCFEVNEHLEKKDAPSVSIMTIPNLQALNSTDIFVLTASVGYDELHALESYL